jgi:hypothetical protein
MILPDLNLLVYAYGSPMPQQNAGGLAAPHVESWLARPMVRVVNPGPRHAEIAFGLLRSEGWVRNLTIPITFLI